MSFCNIEETRAHLSVIKDFSEGAYQIAANAAANGFYFDEDDSFRVTLVKNEQSDTLTMTEGLTALDIALLKEPKIFKIHLV